MCNRPSLAEFATLVDTKPNTAWEHMLPGKKSVFLMTLQIEFKFHINIGILVAHVGNKLQARKKNFCNSKFLFFIWTTNKNSFSLDFEDV
jgi:hypothetical protein